ncbi:MAG: DUF421 domain-containing protein [Candidatus Methylomirabilales bacterium]
MSVLTGVDWAGVLLPATPVLEIVVRGTLTYLVLFLILRLVLKRETGQVGITDLLVVVLLAEAAQNAIADDYRSVPDGILLVCTIIFWNHALNWLGYRFPRFERLIHPPPLRLIQDGRLLYRNMRQEMITEGELMSFLRQQGVDDIRLVKEAHMEGDGRISVIPYDRAPAPAARRVG